MRSRLLTAIGLIPFVLGAFFCASPWPIFGLACLIGIVCCYELAALLGQKSVYVGFLLACSAYVAHRLSRPFAPMELQVSLLFTFFIGLVATWLGTRARRGAVLLAPALAPFWFLAPLLSLVHLHGIRTGGEVVGSFWHFQTPILLAVLPLWGGDTAAIFAGRAFGKHPLAPSISPNKTVEGSIANLAVCVLVAIPVGLWLGYPWWVGALCGLVAGTLGQAGDLFESYVKRQVGVKDSGTILPGHGGVLDRIDSVIFTAPFVALILASASRSG